MIEYWKKLLLWKCISILPVSLEEKCFWQSVFYPFHLIMHIDIYPGTSAAASLLLLNQLSTNAAPRLHPTVPHLPNVFSLFSLLIFQINFWSKDNCCRVKRPIAWQPERPLPLVLLSKWQCHNLAENTNAHRTYVFQEQSWVHPGVTILTSGLRTSYETLAMELLHAFLKRAPV